MRHLDEFRSWSATIVTWSATAAYVAVFVLAFGLIAHALD